MDKTGRNGLRVGDILRMIFIKNTTHWLKTQRLTSPVSEIEFDLNAEEEKWFASLETLKSIKTVNGEYFINQALTDRKKFWPKELRIYAGHRLWHLPYVTSSNTITAGVCPGLGHSAVENKRSYRHCKSLLHKGGLRSISTEQDNETGEKNEGHRTWIWCYHWRPRRCGWIDLATIVFIPLWSMGSHKSSLPNWTCSTTLMRYGLGDLIIRWHRYHRIAIWSVYYRNANQLYTPPGLEPGFARYHSFHQLPDKAKPTLLTWKISWKPKFQWSQRVRKDQNWL